MFVLEILPLLDICNLEFKIPQVVDPTTEIFDGTETLIVDTDCVYIA